jgi:hypothetical protein
MPRIPAVFVDTRRSYVATEEAARRPARRREFSRRHQRVIGMDIHRTFAEVVFWEAGRLRPAGRIDMTRSGLEGSAAV